MKLTSEVENIIIDIFDYPSEIKGMQGHLSCEMMTDFDDFLCLLEFKDDNNSTADTLETVSWTAINTGNQEDPNTWHGHDLEVLLDDESN